MSIGNLIWLFFLMTMMQPIMARKFLEMARERALRHLETTRGTKVIAMVHRQETMSLFGFPVLRYINIEDSEEILRAIKMTDPDTPSTLFSIRRADLSWPRPRSHTPCRTGRRRSPCSSRISPCRAGP